jgi:PAS domain S-box-containing protein
MEELKAQKQTKIYKRLHAIGKSLNETLTIDELYEMAVSFVSSELNFQKCLIFEHDDSNGWFKVVKSVGYTNPMELKILNIINLLLSGEVIEHLRLSNEPILHTKENPNEVVGSLTKSLFLSEAYFELFGGDVEIPHSLIVVGNGIRERADFSVVTDDMIQLALGNFITQLSNTINNIVFYKAWSDEKILLEDNIKRRTKQLNEQKETFEAIYKTSKDGIAIIDLETTAFLDVNPAYCDMTGYTKEELLRTSCMKLSSEKDRDRSKEVMQTVARDGYIRDFIKSCHNKSGKEIVINMSISLMSDGKTVLASSKDITKQQAIEREIRISHKNIKDSIKFASLIQEAILPLEQILQRYTKESFVFWQPKDEVGGDIYFVTELSSGSEVIIMVIDGAGHGVPGAFVTMLVKAIETQIVAEIESGKLEPSPAKILEYFNIAIKTMLKQDKRSKSNAGFDGGVLYYNRERNICKYAGAKTPLYIVRDAQLEVVKSDRKNVGFVRTKIDQKYSEYDIEIDSGVQLYITTDGVIDQEGINGSRYGKTKFEELVLENSSKSLVEQREILVSSFREFKSDIAQSDDITVVGLKF